jgi:hypothetical protein
MASPETLPWFRPVLPLHKKARAKNSARASRRTKRGRINASLVRLSLAVLLWRVLARLQRGAENIAE